MIQSKVAVLAVLAVLTLVGPAFAQDGGGAAAAGMIGLAAGLGMAIAAAGAAYGQGKATAAAMESIGRNPNSADKIFVPLILGLALMEALALYMLVIAFFLQGKIA
jgi:F-type H+-transporting ATPase subunit c